MDVGGRTMPGAIVEEVESRLERRPRNLALYEYQGNTPALTMRLNIKGRVNQIVISSKFADAAPP